jgi:hypothetical protein
VENTMNHLPLVGLSLLALGATAAAQVQIPVNSRATYLRTENDPLAQPSPGIPVSALGVTAGQWLSIGVTGSYSDGGGPDNSENLVALFSSSATLLPNAPGLVNRVPGAIAAGAAIETAPTYYGLFPTDVPQDFVVASEGWSTGTLVRVPAGATHVFVCVNDATWSFFGNNVDPNNDYFVVFAPAVPPLLHGTKEHCELRTGINGAATATPDIKQANPFSTLSAEVHQRFGVSNNDIYVLAANVFATAGSPPVGPLPDIHMGLDFVIMQVGIVAPTPGLWSFFVPPGYAGTTLILQGFFLESTARNGFLDCSDAHRIELQ